MSVATLRSSRHGYTLLALCLGVAAFFCGPAIASRSLRAAAVPTLPSTVSGSSQTALPGAAQAAQPQQPNSGALTYDTRSTVGSASQPAVVYGPDGAAYLLVPANQQAASNNDGNTWRAPGGSSPVQLQPSSVSAPGAQAAGTGEPKVEAAGGLLLAHALAKQKQEPAPQVVVVPAPAPIPTQVAAAATPAPRGPFTPTVVGSGGISIITSNPISISNPSKAHNEPYTTAVNTLLSIPLSHLTEAGCAMSKRFYSLALLLLGGQLLTAVSAGKSAAANATLVAPGLLRSARALTQTPSACTDGVTYFTANGIPYTVNNCATCKDGKVGNRLCGWSIDCCSSSGFCGPTEEWCGANCIGGPCGQKITVPSNRLCGSGFRGNGQCTSGCCNERGSSQAIACGSPRAHYFTLGSPQQPAWIQQRDQPVRGLMLCFVVAPRQLLQPFRSQPLPQAAAPEPGPSAPSSARTPRGKGKGTDKAAQPSPPVPKEKAGDPQGQRHHFNL
ncbi:hypothetical protein QJQ45_012131 [Haematococcus lacustris]|nr:hypothetical protein QJQ45_012131 [Haematococcus lacustris]